VKRREQLKGTIEGHSTGQGLEKALLLGVRSRNKNGGRNKKVIEGGALHKWLESLEGRTQKKEVDLGLPKKFARMNVRESRSELCRTETKAFSVGWLVGRYRKAL